MRVKCQKRWISLACLLLLVGGCAWLNPPTAVVHVSQTRGTVPFELTYDAGSSTGSGGVSNYLWSFDDGTVAYGSSGTHVFRHAGQYEVQLTIRAADGSVDHDTVLIHVEPAFWVADESLNTIYKLDLSGRVLQTLPSPHSQPRGVGLVEMDGHVSLFAACAGDGFQRLIELDPDSGDLLSEFTAPAHSPGGLAASPPTAATLWHIDHLSRMIYQISPRDGRVMNVFGASYFQASSQLIGSVFLQTPGGVAWKEGSDEPGSLWVLESETRRLYELEIVTATDIFSATQLRILPDPIVLSASLFPIAGLDWYDGYLWVVERDRHQVSQVDPATGLPTGVALRGFPGAAVSGLAIQR